MKATVIKGFRDINDFSKVYKLGDEVDFDESRIEKCVKLGLVEVKETEEQGDVAKKGIITVAGKEFEKSQVLEALKNIEVKVAANIGDAKLVEKLNELTEEETAKFKTALGIEETGEQ